MISKMIINDGRKQDKWCFWYREQYTLPSKSLITVKVRAATNVLSMAPKKSIEGEDLPTDSAGAEMIVATSMFSFASMPWRNVAPFLKSQVTERGRDRQWGRPPSVHYPYGQSKPGAKNPIWIFFKDSRGPGTWAIFPCFVSRELDQKEGSQNVNSYSFADSSIPRGNLTCATMTPLFKF